MAEPIKQNAFINKVNQYFSYLMHEGDVYASNYAQVQWPLLRLPIISNLFLGISRYLANQFSIAAQQQIDKIILDIHKYGTQAAVIQAAKKLKDDGGTNAGDIDNLANAEASAVSYPGSGTFSKF